MEQMNIPEDARVPFDYEDSSLPRPVRELRPAIYRDGDAFCALLGPSLEKGISGRGDTQQAAIEDWLGNLRQRIASADVSDETGMYARDMLNTSVDDVW